MLRKIMAGILSFILLCTSGSPLLASVSALDNMVESDMLVYDHTYPISRESVYWDDYTVLEKVDMLRIPSEKLDRMTDEALVKAIAEYPYLIDIYLYGSSVADGIEVARSYFSALDELLSRNTASESLTKYGLTIANSYYASYNRSSAERDSHDLFVGSALLDIYEYVNDGVSAMYMDGTVVNGSYIALDDVSRSTGSQVVLWVMPETHTEAEHDAADQEILDTYAVTLLFRGSCRYNCHSYAWYSQSANNPYWIEDPTPYMNGGAYVRKYNGGIGTPSSSTSVRAGDIIFYGDVNGSQGTWHSAIYISQTNSGMPLASQRCVSKWGARGVFEHSIGNVPAEYDISIISAWREA